MLARGDGNGESMLYVFAVIVLVAAVLGVLLTAAGLPGIWIALATAAVCDWLRPELFDLWTLIAVAGIAAVAEILEFVASAVGASKAGGTRRGAIGALVGGLFGAVLGSIFIPIPVLGTILGSALGAGIGALAAERRGGEKTWREATKVGTGAAAGRLVASVLKTTLAAAAAIVLGVAAFV